MRRKHALIVVALVAAAVAGSSAQSGYDLYQQALVKERGDGQLQEAVALYLSVVKSSGGDRGLAARALLQVASCYEKLGNRDEARTTYMRVRTEFADQITAATTARARVAQLASRETASERVGVASQAADATPQRVDLPRTGGPSPDGRYFGFWKDSDVAVRDLATGEITTLTAGSKTAYVQDWEWSADSRRLLYTWVESAADRRSTTQLRVIGVDGKGGQPVGPKVEDLDLLAWSPDGHTALVSVQAGSASVRQLISVDDGSVRELKARQGPYDTIGFSPDGQHVLYTPIDFEKPRGIFIVGIDGSEERALIQDSSENQFVGWTPSGRGLLFASDRSGTWDLWLVHVSNGRLEDLPVKVRADVGPLGSRGLTSAGVLYYDGGGEVSDVYTVSLDTKTARVLSPPAPVTQTAGHSAFPVWSSDGRQLAFKSGPSGPIWPTISILSMEGGQARHLRTSIRLGPRFDWSPDGRFFIQGASARPTRQGPWSLYRVDAQTGDMSLIMTYGNGENLNRPRWFHDGRSVSYIRRATNEIVVRDLDTAVERTIVTARPLIHSYAVSPDGDSVAFISARDPGGARSDIHITTLADGRTRTLVEYQHHPVITGQCCDALTWSPDSRYVIYADRTADTFVTGTTERRMELWRIAVAGGPAEKLGLTLDDLEALALSPDGRRLAFMQSADRAGLWMLGNFLPASELRRGATAGRQR